MTKPLSTVLIGVGGYGALYCNALLNNTIPDLKLTAIVDPYAKSSRLYDRFKDAIPVYDSLEDFFATGQKAEFTIVSSPIHLHYPQSVTALANGSHVFCEKPLVPNLCQLDLLDEKIAASGKTLHVGFQWCYSSVMQALKARFISGEFGRPVCFKNLAPAPRDWEYYGRNNWAGRVKTDDGHIVNDSVASNATAHYIQNMLFLLGGTMEESAELSNTHIELYRANDIESFDTCIFRGEAAGATVFYAASHAISDATNTPMRYKLEKAEIIINIFDHAGECIIHHQDGRVENLGPAMQDGEVNKLKYAVQSIRGERPIICSALTARPITALIDVMFKQDVHCFPPEHIVVDSANKRTYVKNLHLELEDCFNQTALPSEIGMSWAMAPARLF